MNKISREALLEMAHEAGIAVHPLKQQARIGIDTITGDDSTEKLERFADLVAAAQQQQADPVAQDWQTELLDWVSACQSAYYIDNTEGHRFGGLGSNLEENRAGIVEFVSELLLAAQQPTVNDSLTDQAVIPAGYALVPVDEPTDEMVVRGAEALSDSFRCLGIDIDEDPRWSEMKCDIAQSVFSAMIDFAPQPPVVSVPDDVAKDAWRYRLLRHGRHWSVIDGIGDELRGEVLDAAIDAAAQKGGAA